MTTTYIYLAYKKKKLKNKIHEIGDKKNKTNTDKKFIVFRFH